jgi:class 3 adenylate cyclase/tetratricopeptide (TPR) repeat protein
VTTCTSCGSENATDSRFCSACGAPLEAAVAERPEVRKTVSVVFADVRGSTALGEALDPEAARKLMARYFEQARTILERHGGTVEKFIGDAVMAVFGVPQLHEDDALRAVRAAAELRDGVTEVQLRIGVNTGEVVAGGGETLVTGDAVNVAARLEQAAQPGEVLLGEQTYALVRDAVEVEPAEPLSAKGKTDPVVAYRLRRVVEGADPFSRRLDAPLVGREREQRLLREAFERAVEERSCHLFTLLGTAGIGKSRLAQELVENLGDSALVLTGRCLPYGEGITYWPLVEIVRELGSEANVVGYLEGEPDARAIINHVFAAVGIADEELSAEETFWAVRKLFEALAREKALVVVLDDLHWAESTFLDLVEHLADWSREAPILLLCLARPELLDTRPGWSGGKLNATSLLLEPLSATETETLIDNLFARLAESLRNRITEAAEGNPLFVEQMLAMLTEQVELDGELQVPPTIQALLAARLDRLPAPERATLERAAVIGKEFTRGAIAALGGDSALLLPLVRKELIRPDRTSIGDDDFRFRHLLVRDAAYDAVPKELRAELHEQFANWTETQRSEYDEIVGYHLEQAYSYKEELGTIDDELARRAASRLANAGLRAEARGDIHAVANLLGRATALMSEDNVDRLELLIALSSALHSIGQTEEATALLEEVVERSQARGERALELRAGLTLQGQHAWLQPEGAGEAIREAAEAAIAELEQVGDDRALGEAWAAINFYYVERLNAAGIANASDHALFHARRAGDRRLEQEALTMTALAAYLGSTPVDDAIPRIEGVLSEVAVASNRSSEAFVWTFLADLHSQRGEHETARQLADRSDARWEELGNRRFGAGSAQTTAYVDLRAGDPVAAEERLRAAYETLEGMGEKGSRCGVSAVLAEALYRQGRLGEAERFAEISEELAGSSDVIAQMWWREVKAKLLARRGDEAEALRLAREAVERSEPTDNLVGKGEAYETLGETLGLLGKVDQARTAYERALELYELKGSIVDAGRVAAQRAALDSTAVPD